MNRHIQIVVGSACVWASLAMVVPASAASLDCAHASSRQERLICSQPELSSLHDQLMHAYQARKSALSAQGAALLEKSEQSWRRFVATVCSFSVPTYGDFRRVPKYCIATEYRNRLKQLAQVAVRIGPFVFNRIDLFAAEPDQTHGSGSMPGFYIQHLAYPQIDDPRSPQAAAWNRQNAKRLSERGTCDAGFGDYDTDYSITYASRRLISTRWRSSFYCHDTPHGTGNAYSENVVLQPGPRRLTASDLFGPGMSWIAPLQRLFWAALQKDGWRLSGDAVQSAKPQIEGIVVQPGRWSLTRRGLEVVFSAYEGGCYVCTPPPVTVPWPALKPLLAQDALVP